MTGLLIMALGFPAWFLQWPIEKLADPDVDRVVGEYRYLCYWRGNGEWAGVKLSASQPIGELLIGVPTEIWWPSDDQYCTGSVYKGPCGTCHE